MGKYKVTIAAYENGIAIKRVTKGGMFLYFYIDGCAEKFQTIEDAKKRIKWM